MLGDTLSAKKSPALRAAGYGFPKYMIVTTLMS
jgi:hypothetical protein